MDSSAIAVPQEAIAATDAPKITAVSTFLFMVTPPYENN
jgi:hypothetical protein